MVKHRHVLAWAAAASFAATAAVAAAQKPAPSKDRDQDKHPTLKLTARPPLGMSPARIVLTADLNGGPNDAEDYYCPTVEWDLGDGTMSESSPDCEPRQPGHGGSRGRYHDDPEV